MLLNAKVCISIVTADFLDSMNAPVRGRLLSQVASDALPAQVVTPQSARIFISPSQKWVIIWACTLCGVLFLVLVALWMFELASSRTRRKKQAQDEACKNYIQTYMDIESPTKLEKPNNYIEGIIGSPERLQQDVTKASTAAIPRSPSLRTNLTIATSPSQVGKNPVDGGRMGGHQPVACQILRRNSSSTRYRGGGIAVIRRSSSSRGYRSGSMSPTSPHSSGVPEAITVDLSIQIRDVGAIGWAHNPHVTPHTSVDVSLAQSSYALSAATLQYNSSTMAGDPILKEAKGSAKHRLATEGNPTSSGPSNATDANTTWQQRQDEDQGSKSTYSVGKPLVRLPTDGQALADFKLTTSVAEMEESAPGDIYKGASGQSVDMQRRTSSAEGAGGLHTAKSIKPMEVPSTSEMATHGTALDLSCSELKVYGEDIGQQPSSTPMLHGRVRVLTAEQFSLEVQLVRLLGAGGAGCVHEAVWRGRRVAVKTLHASRQVSPTASLAFRQEVDLMAAVGLHPCIIEVLGACLEPPFMAIIAELAEGGSLAALLHDRAVRPRYGTFLQIAEDVALAMQHCHSLRLVHRDLKTHNVLLSAEGRAKVADFGLAAARNRTFLTVEPGALGTASVMAPEQFAAQEVTERCDSYAFGCLLWEMLTGKAPWAELSNIMQIVMAVGCERRRPVLPLGCPPALARLIRECWRHNAALRPGFSEILERLRRMRRDDAAAAAVTAASEKLTNGGVPYRGRLGKILRPIHHRTHPDTALTFN